MGTHRLYYDDSYMQNFAARLVQCIPAEPFVTELGTVPVWEVLLDRSAFYPTSGGQPNDLGSIDDVRVLDVRDEDDEIVHIVDRELAKGEVQGCVQWPRRFEHMQQHTGQHLLSAMFQERYGLPTLSFHLGGELCTIDVRGPEPSAEVLEGAQRASNEVVFADRPVNVRYGTAEQLAELGVRKEVERAGLLRAIEIEGADLQPCGGTHVKSTGQIGVILVRRVTKIRQDWRVEFACGARAARLASSDFRLLRSIGEQLSCAPEQAVASIEKASAERDAHFKAFRAMTQQYVETRARLLIAESPASQGQRRVITQVLREENAEVLLPLATELAKQERTVALLAHGESGQLVFAQHTTAGNDLAWILRKLLAVVSGKGGGTRDFVRAKLSDAGRAAEALELAARLISES
jgi:alanyl-tRNA synthetase